MHMLRVSALTLLGLVMAAPGFAREAGWVPLPDKPWQPPAASTRQERVKRPSKPAPQAKDIKPGSTVYEGQPPITKAELEQFIVLLPRFRAWARQNQEEAHPIVNPQGKADFLYSPSAAKWISGNNFSPARFFCAMGRMATCLVIIEEGNDLQSARPRDMPQVDPAEVSLARQYLGELLAAGGASAPIN